MSSPLAGGALGTYLSCTYLESNLVRGVEFEWGSPAFRPVLSVEFYATIFGTIYRTTNRTTNRAKTPSTTMYDFRGFCTICVTIRGTTPPLPPPPPHKALKYKIIPPPPPPHPPLLFSSLRPSLSKKAAAPSLPISIWFITLMLL
jgi:hypothetical protein